jgi:zinc and cadmium transporter
MIWIYFILLFIVTIIGGVWPLQFSISKTWNENLLAFSGAILLAITFLHLVPECIVDLHSSAGPYILIGFFLQLFLQKFSHGLEHGHIHSHAHHSEEEDQHHHHTPILLTPIIIGLSVHAFMEGIPLGHSYTLTNTTPSLFLGIAAHKAPEALTLMSVVATMPFSKIKKWRILLQFAIITPLAGILAYYFGREFYFISHILTYVVPIVIGAFIHIATTIFFESGAKMHQLNKQKVIAILIGLLIGLSTMLG